MRKIVALMGFLCIFAASPKITVNSFGVLEQEEFYSSEVAEMQFESYKDLQSFFNSINYDLSTKKVPLVILKCLPKDMDKIESINQKKELFVKIMLPIILKVNEEITEERDKILSMSSADELSYYLKKYRAKNKQELLEKVLPVPVEIALAQAAIESAWGTSRFAIEANNIFGEWTFKPGTGIIPSDRPEGEIYEVRKFESLIDSVRSYVYNLNVSPFYKEFRDIRAGKINKPVEEGLLYYSQKRHEYIQEIKIIISKNQFTEFSNHKPYRLQLALLSSNIWSNN
ncbi:glucosaminidase domain-containing protein [Pseudothermotoga elfii]|nr:Bax protein [Pseudothermotoga sp.]